MQLQKQIYTDLQPGAAEWLCRTSFIFDLLNVPCLLLLLLCLYFCNININLKIDIPYLFSFENLFSMGLDHSHSID